MMNDYIHQEYNQISICVNMWKNWYQNEAVIPMHHVTEDSQLRIEKAFTLNSLSTGAELPTGCNTGQRWNQIYLNGSV